MKNGFDVLALELVGEKASAIGRIGRELERLCAELTRRQAALVVDESPHRAARVAEYRELRRRAETWFFYLIVQREAMGLRRHDNLDLHYPIPPAVRD